MIKEFFGLRKGRSLAESLDNIDMSVEDLEILEKCQVMSDSEEEIASTRDKIIQTINEIGQEALNERFAQLLQAMVHKDKQYTGPNENRIVRAILLAAQFVTDEVPAFKQMLFDTINVQHTKFFEETQGKLSLEELDKFKENTARATFVKLANESMKTFNRGEIQKSVRRTFAPELKRKKQTQ